MGGIVVDYYKNLLSTNHPTEFIEMLQDLQPKVTLDMNRILAREFTVSEVRMAVKQMYLLKAPDPNGMPLLFYQHFYPNIG